jgi:hypothetical protein
MSAFSGLFAAFCLICGWHNERNPPFREAEETKASFRERVGHPLFGEGSEKEALPAGRTYDKMLGSTINSNG